MPIHEVSHEVMKSRVVCLKCQLLSDGSRRCDECGCTVCRFVHRPIVLSNVEGSTMLECDCRASRVHRRCLSLIGQLRCPCSETLRADGEVSKADPPLRFAGASDRAYLDRLANTDPRMPFTVLHYGGFDASRNKPSEVVIVSPHLEGLRFIPGHFSHPYYSTPRPAPAGSHLAPITENLLGPAIADILVRHRPIDTRTAKSGESKARKSNPPKSAVNPKMRPTRATRKRPRTPTPPRSSDDESNAEKSSISNASHHSDQRPSFADERKKKIARNQQLLQKLALLRGSS